MTRSGALPLSTHASMTDRRSDPIRRLIFARRRDYIVVVVDRVQRRERPIGPAMPQEQLSATSYECTQVRIGQGNYSIVLCPSARAVGVEIEASGIPIWILGDDVAEIARADRRHVRHKWRRDPVDLARRRQSLRDLFVARLVPNTAVDLTRPRDLAGGQAVRSVARLAGEHARVEGACSRIGHRAIAYAITCVAGCDRGFGHQLQLVRRHAFCGVCRRLLNEHSANRLDG
jgi:hypothetical protein